MNTPHWEAEGDDAQPWQHIAPSWSPTLFIDGCAFTLDIGFATQAECEAFIQDIPAGQGR